MRTTEGDGRILHLLGFAPHTRYSVYMASLHLQSAKRGIHVGCPQAVPVQCPVVSIPDEERCLAPIQSRECTIDSG